MNEAREIGAEYRNRARNEPKPKARAVAEVWDFAPAGKPLKQWPLPLSNLKVELGYGHSQATEVTQPHAARPKIDKSAPIFGEPKRIRYQKHLRFVASQPWNAFSRAPHPLRAEPQGKRSIHRAALAIPPHPLHRQRGVVARAQY
jgi:hypothetical protein